MRPLLAALLVLALVAPAARAEFGPYDEHDYPINVLGQSTFPGGIVPGGEDSRALFADDGPLNAVGPLTVYPYWPVLTAEVQRLAMEHSDIMKLHSAGKSTAGLDLWMLEIADFSRIDSGEGIPLDAREVVWVDGGTHSNEYSGVYFVAHLASFLTDEYATNDTAKWIVENRHTWLMPMVNPDGSNVMGRLNAHLVNINRNYPVVWDGVGHDALMNNRGPHPASEVETQINIEWFNRTTPDYYASVHCCGNLWLYPYGEEGVDPVDNEVLARVCEDAFPSVREDCGPIWSTIYPASGSSVDTAYEFTGAVSFGYEMSGRGAVGLWGQPFTHESVRVQEVESWEGVLHAFQHVHRYGAYPVIEAAAVVGDALELRVQNAGYGNLTSGSVTAGGQTVALPMLAPGESATVRVGGAALAEGEMPVRVEYVKRVMASPAGAQDVPLTLARMGDGTLGVTAIAGAQPASTLDVGLGENGVPGFVGAAGLLVLALVALLRRK